MLQRAQVRYQPDTYVRCIIKYVDGNKSELLYNRFLFKMDNIAYKADTALLSLILDSDPIR